MAKKNRAPKNGGTVVTTPGTEEQQVPSVPPTEVPVETETSPEVVFDTEEKPELVVEEVNNEGVTDEELEAASKILDKQFPELTEAEKVVVDEVNATLAESKEHVAYTLTTPTDKQTYSEDVGSKIGFVSVGGMDKQEMTQVFVGNNTGPEHTMKAAEAPQAAEGKTNSKYLLNGHSASAILRFMGHNGISAAPAKKILTKIGMHPMPAQATIQTQVQRGKSGESILPLGEELEQLILDTHLELLGAGSKHTIDLPAPQTLDDAGTITVVAGKA